MGNIPTRDDLLKLISIEEKVLGVLYAEMQQGYGVHNAINSQEHRINMLREILDSNPEFQ